MQGNDLELIKKAAQNARKALEGKNLGFGLAPNAAQANVQAPTAQAPQVQPTTTAATPTAATSQQPAPTKFVQESEKQQKAASLRAFTEQEIKTLEKMLLNGDHYNARDFILLHKDIDLNNPKASERFDNAMREHSTYMQKESIAWRAPISLRTQSENRQMYENNLFRRFLMKEQAKRAGTQSHAERIVEIALSSKDQREVAVNFRELLHYLIARDFNSATKALHKHSARFVVTPVLEKIIGFAIELAQQSLSEELQDRGYRYTVAESRRDEEDVSNFNEDLNQFKVTLEKYKSGAALPKYEAPNPYRGYNWDSST